MPRFYSKDGVAFETFRFAQAVDKLGLPNVSSISKGLTSDFYSDLNAQNMARHAVAYSKTNPDATVDDCVIWARNNSKSQIIRARDEGTEIHDLIASIISPKKFKYKRVLLNEAVVNAVKAELKSYLAEQKKMGWEPDQAEFAVVNLDVGFGGRCDFRMADGKGGYLYVDWKTKSNETYQRIYGVQISAYLKSERAAVSSFAQIVMIDRSTGKFTVRELENSEVDECWDIFKAEHNAYCARNRYPIKKVLENILTQS